MRNTFNAQLFATLYWRLAQILPKESKVNAQNIGLNQLAIFGYKLLLFGIELRDCILIGTENHFSFKEDSTTWNKYRTQVDFLKDLTSGKDIDIEALQKELKN